MNTKAIAKEILKGTLISFIVCVILSTAYIFISDNTNINFGDDSSLLFLYNPVLVIILAFVFLFRRKKILSLGILAGYPLFIFAVSLFFALGCVMTGVCM